MTAIALEDLKFEHRAEKYPILVLRDDNGNLFELYVRDDPRAAYFKLAALEREINAHQARMPITKVFEPYRRQT